MMQEKVTEYARSLIQMGRKNLEDDGELDPIGVVLFGEESEILPLDFSSDTSKISSCEHLAELAKRVGAYAGGAMFVGQASVFDNSAPERYRALLVLFKGPHVAPFALEIPFQRVDDRIIFLELTETYDGVRIDMFPDWY